MLLRKHDPFKVASIDIGNAMKLAVYAWTANEIGTPTVGLGNNFADFIGNMSPETADELGSALKRAALIARGDIGRAPQ